MVYKRQKKNTILWVFIEEKMKIPKELIKNIESKLNCKITSHKVLGSGAHNLNYLLETDKGKFVLRIYANLQFDNCEKEYAILKKLDGQFAPKALLSDTSKKFIEYNYMIQEFIEGQPIKELSDDLLVKIADLMKKVHSITDESKDRPPKIISDWCRKNLLETSKKMGAEFNTSMVELYNQVKTRVDKIKPLLKNYKRIHLIHDDPVLENFLVQDENIVLIDWELAGYDYFFMDLGTFIAENHITKEQEEKFLKAYGFGQTDEEKQIIQITKTYRILGLISWLIERICLIKEGKQKHVGADLEKHEKQLKKEIAHINELLK
ncbi:aminoglycoside phosphotransferase family protein [Candidatus Woesearchaeota archaeon]|nr:aminoglycoside phosphotransferase family protein [Candidatus Woesearchaeota archaeon]